MTLSVLTDARCDFVISFFCFDFFFLQFFFFWEFLDFGPFAFSSFFAEKKKKKKSKSRATF